MFAMKYPRTPHLPWSAGGTADDVRLCDLAAFSGKRLIILEKLDGENTVMTHETIHARSEDGYGKPWQTSMKRMWSCIRNDIPEWMHLCGECTYAVHSIEYARLDSIFHVFGIFTDDGRCLSWKDVVEWSELLGFNTVPVITAGSIDDIHELPIPTESIFGGICEGYVIRNIEGFPAADFASNVAKCVRKDHVTTDEHWTKNWKKQVMFA